MQQRVVCVLFWTMYKPPKRQLFAILVLAFFVVLRPDPAWANAGWVFVAGPLGLFIAVLMFLLLVRLESCILSYVLNMELSKAKSAALWANVASALVGMYLPTTIHFGDILSGLIFTRTPAAGILSASAQFVVVAAGVSTLVEFPIIYRFAKGRWWPKNDSLVMSENIAVLAMNFFTTVLLVVFALGVNSLVNSVADKIGQ